MVFFSEQKFFSDSPVEHPVTLSPKVLKVLLASQPAKGTFAAMNDSERAEPSQFFQAAEVHLRSSDDVDLVVIGIGRMSGADNTWFWVVRSARQDHPRVVLFSGGSALYLMDTRTNGYRDIRVVWSSASETDTTTYHFSVSDYRVWKKQSNITN